MDPRPAGDLPAHFAALPDPRVERTKRHPLLDIVTSAVCAVIAGADTWVAVAAFGRRTEAFLRQFLTLPKGIPSHDTFGRVFAALDPAAFEPCVLAWVQATVQATAGQVVAIDGYPLGDDAAALARPGGGEGTASPRQCLGRCQSCRPGPGGGGGEVE
jgi:hypothetical protein